MGCNWGEGIVRGDPDETELWSEIMDGGSRDVMLEVSEKAGDVSGGSMGRLMDGSVYSGVSWREHSDPTESLREDADWVSSEEGAG